MKNPADILALIIDEKQDEINRLKAALEESEQTEDRHFRWWQEEEAKVKQLQATVAQLEADLMKADPTRNAIKLSKNA